MKAHAAGRIWKRSGTMPSCTRRQSAINNLRASLLTVEKGYETALGAALGDDLDAPVEPAAPIHWAGAPADAGDPVLPAGVVPLSDFIIAAPEAMARRLAQIGVVARADGARIAGAPSIAMTLRVTMARSARRERKLWTGRPSSVQRLRALRWAAWERSALATTEGRAASAAALS
jgi:chromosome segregation protein